ncbi:MAG TPA: hypothetical protein VFG23_24650, partial [Polyangia bacterium]|nr:hypothetical protein [Polyangia bacterium]
MKSALSVVLCLTLFGAGFARAQETGAATEPQAVMPPTAPPNEAPPSPPQQPPAPPAEQAPQEAAAEGALPPQAAQPQPVATGQWVYTEQYGWVWMPYGNQYTYEGTASGSEPYEYLYEQSYGWTWLAAPWVWG